MKRIFNNVFKWLVLVLISYSLLFTGMFVFEQGGIIQAIAYKIDSMDGDIFDNIEDWGIEEVCKHYQKQADSSFGNMDEEYLEIGEEEIEYQRNESQLYELYPAGYSMMIRDVAMLQSMSNLHITSFVMGIAIGTAVYMMLDKDKKELKVLVSLYIIFLILLGFVEGIQSVVGENSNLLDKWIFPKTYIVPITAVFILAIIVRILRHRDIAKQLNIKLQEKKNKIEDSNNKN